MKNKKWYSRAGLCYCRPDKISGDYATVDGQEYQIHEDYSDGSCISYIERIIWCLGSDPQSDFAGFVMQGYILV